MVSGPWNHIAPSLYPLVSCIPCTPPAPPLYPLPLSGPLLPIHPLSPFLSFPFSRGWAHIRLRLAILPTAPPSPISHFPLLAISLTAPLPIPSLSFMCVANLLLLEKSLLAQDNCIPPHILYQLLRRRELCFSVPQTLWQIGGMAKASIKKFISHRSSISEL